MFKYLTRRLVVEYATYAIGSPVLAVVELIDILRWAVGLIEGVG